MADMPSEAALDASAVEVRLNRLINLILETAVDVLGFDAATITARDPGGQLATIGATDQRLIALDDAQYETGSGPCLTVLQPHDPIFLENAGDARDQWEAFALTAAHLGVGSSLSLHVPTDSAEVAASLNLYARQRLDQSAELIRAAESFAQQLAAAIESAGAFKATAKLARDMAEAMRSRATIEQAKGILIADHEITPDEAFQRLVALSQQSNRKLRDIAQRLVAERAPLSDDARSAGEASDPRAPTPPADAR